MKQDDPQFKFRLKPDLKKQLEQAASDNTRTLGAEIVARLEASFENQAIPTSREAGMLVAAFHTQYHMLGLRMDLIQARIESLGMRSRLIQSDSERLTREAKTDEDFARAQESTEQLRAVEAEARALGLELEQVVQERAALNKQNADMRAMLAEGRKGLEDRLNTSRKIMVGNLGGDAPTIYDEIQRGHDPVIKNSPTNRVPTQSTNARKSVVKKR